MARGSRLKDVTNSSFDKKHFRRAKGIELVADVAGNPSNPCVILLHGGGQTRHSWGGAMRALVEAGCHVINLDARGHGESAWCPDGMYSVATRSLDLPGGAKTRTRPMRPGRRIHGRRYGHAHCDQAPNTDHGCETLRAKIQRLATPTGVQTRRLLLVSHRARPAPRREAGGVGV